MEFSISNNAKRLTLILIGAGTLLTLVGLFTTMGDHHFKTRLLANGLINGFLISAVRHGMIQKIQLNMKTLLRIQ